MDWAKAGGMVRVVWVVWVGVGGWVWVGVVGAARFELTTSCSRSKRATKLRHAPTVWEAVGGELYQKSGRNGGFILHRFASVSPPSAGGGRDYWVSPSSVSGGTSFWAA